jgi:hypothetical protein
MSESFEAYCARKSKGKPEAKTAHNSTLPAASKPLATKGKRGKRLAADDAAIRKQVFERDPGCVACKLFGAPVETRSGPDEWAHVHGRLTHQGVDTRQDPAYSVRLCPSHHDMHHGKGSHTLGIAVYPVGSMGRRWKQVFTIDGTLSDSRIVEAGA